MREVSKCGIKKMRQMFRARFKLRVKNWEISSRMTYRNNPILFYQFFYQLNSVFDLGRKRL